MSTESHWQRVYQSKAVTEVSWYAAHLEQSIRLISAAVPKEGRIIDVGGGASTLVDDLLGSGYENLTVLDISGAALAAARARLGKKGALVQWLDADVTSFRPAQNAFDLWHDRAVFHFLTEKSQRAAYLENLNRGLVPGGTVVIATFSLDGPTKCSGLEVVRYSAQTLGQELGSNFQLAHSEETTHTTPAGAAQRFVTCQFRKAV